MPHPPDPDNCAAMSAPTLQFRDLPIVPPIVLAPMEGLTDLAFRRLVRRIGGPGLTCTEFVAAEGLVREAARVLEMATLDPDEVPASIQIYGRNPASLGEAARIARDLGAHVVDVNMGCPSKKVCAHSGGVALMRDPALVRDIVRTVRAAVSGPLTVKIRAGWSPAERNAVQIARICEEEGADGLTVHWRTREDAFGGTLRLDIIREVREAVRIPVVGNGDVVDVPSAARMLQETGCAGLMVGRGAVKDPWLPLRLARWFRNEPMEEPTSADRLAFLLAYLEAERKVFRTESGALGRLKKLMGYFGRGVPGGAVFRQSVLHATTLGEARDRIVAFFESDG